MTTMHANVQQWLNVSPLWRSGHNLDIAFIYCSYNRLRSGGEERGSIWQMVTLMSLNRRGEITKEIKPGAKY